MRIESTAELTATERAALRAMLDAAYDGDFSDHDWDHALGGVHLIARDGAIVSHAAVVPRELVVGGRPFRAGYVEAVATARAHRGRGHGTAVMRAATALIADRYELGALCTGAYAFYERLGWERWLGKTYVRTASGRKHTPEEDDAIMIVRTPACADLDVTQDMSCEPRLGDVW